MGGRSILSRGNRSRSRFALPHLFLFPRSPAYSSLRVCSLEPWCCFLATSAGSSTSETAGVCRDFFDAPERGQVAEGLHLAISLRSWCGSPQSSGELPFPVLVFWGGCCKGCKTGEVSDKGAVHWPSGVISFWRICQGAPSRAIALGRLPQNWARATSRLSFLLVDLAGLHRLDS